MDEFYIFLKLGLEHITDIEGYDHMLFIVTLCAIYTLSDWKRILVLVTAFTLGHSVTLALAVMDILVLPPKLIEALIPITIFLTALHNLWAKPERQQQSKKVSYLLALGFGFIHGMGFSNFLKAILMSEDSIFTPLLAFNIGLEIGQLVVVFFFFALLALLVLVSRSLFQRSFPYRRWTQLISILSGLASLYILYGVLTE